MPDPRDKTRPLPVGSRSGFELPPTRDRKSSGVDTGAKLMAILLISRLEELGLVAPRGVAVPGTDALSLADFLGVDPSYMRRLLRGWARRGILEAESVPQPGTPPIILFRLGGPPEALLELLDERERQAG